MKRYVLNLTIFSLAMISIVGMCNAGEEGTSGGMLLSQAIDARAVGMAESFTAMHGSVSCLHYNPAGLANLSENQVLLMYQRGIAEDNLAVVDVGIPSPMGTFAAGLLYYNMGNIELIDTSGNERTVNAQTDYLVTVSYSYPVVRTVSVGLNAKMLQSTLVEEEKGTAYAVDLGVLCLINKLNVGLAVQNIGSEMKYIDEGDELPMTVRGGISYQIEDLLTSVDIIKPNDGNIKGHIGLEYLVGEIIALRTGYKIGYDLDSVTFGLGVKLNKLQLDYGLSLKDELDYTHHASVSIYF